MLHRFVLARSFTTAFFLGCVIAVAAEGAAERFQAASSHRIATPIMRDWTFNYFPAATADALGCEAPGFDDATWPAIALPHTWSTYETTGELHPYIRNPAEKTTPYWWYGWGWYRKHFAIDASQKGRKVFVEFDGVQKYCKVWLNGKLVGDHKGGFHSFYFDLTDAVRFGEDNVLVVAVNNRQADAFRIPVMDAGNWDIYGGIYRPVRLVITDRLYVPFQGSYRHEGGTFITTPTVSSAEAQVRVRTWVKNDFADARAVELVTTIIDADGRVVLTFPSRKTIAAGELAEFDDTRLLAAPRLWSPDTPNLYTAISEVRTGDAVADVFESTFGVRSIRWQFAEKTGDNILFVNEKPVNLQGFISHQEYPWVGDAQPAWMRLQDLRDMKENLGCNFFRSGHYTTGREVYDYCDRHGMMVVEDVPNVKDKNFARDIQEQQVREMVRRDRNRPSIFAWCMGDESNKAADSKWAHEEDPTRFVHARDCPGDASGEFISLPSKNIRLGRLMSCTVRGWYDRDEWSFEPKNHQSTSNEERQHAMAIGGKDSAAGATGSDGRIDQRNMIVWLYEDHGCARTYQNEPVLNINPKGWVDAYRFPKYAYYLWQANHNSAPMVFIHPHYWRAQYLGQKHDFIVDSNCDSVELKLDGHTLGTLRPTEENLHVVTFRGITVTRGRLTAEGTKNGNKVVAELPLTGDPARVVVATAQPKLEAARDSVAIVKADIVDVHGDHVYGATNTVHWSVEGPATLVGAHVYQTDIAKNMELDGTMYIDMPTANVIRSTGQPGVVKVRAQAAGIVLGEVTITMEATRPAANAAIVQQPALPPGPRSCVKRAIPELASSPLPSAELRAPDHDLRLTATATAGDVGTQLQRDNPGVALDARSPEFNALTQTLARELALNRGVVPAADYAFALRRYHRARQLAGFVETSAALPAPFKAAVRAHIADTIVASGNDLGVGETQAWLAAVPSDSTLAVAPTEAGASTSDAAAIVARLRSEFAQLDAGAREAALERLLTINPLLHRRATAIGDRKTNDQQCVVVYTIAAGQPLLVPSIAWLRASPAAH